MTGRYRCVDSGETYAGGLREAARMDTISQTAGYIEVFGNYSTWRAEMSGTVPGASATLDWHCDVRGARFSAR